MTQTGHQVVFKKLRLAGILIALGLVTEAITLEWNHPLAFMAFLGLGVLLMAVGMGVVEPRVMGGTLVEPLAGIVNGADCPNVVAPPLTQVARARTGPKFAGIFGSTQVPSVFTCTVRLSTLTTQF